MKWESPTSIISARVYLWTLSLSAVGTLVCIVAGSFWPAQFFPAYLVAFLFWLGLSLGGLAISMLHHMTGGGWGTAIRRIVEAAAGVLPLMAILFLPILLGMRRLYIWSDSSIVAEDEILLRKADYLNFTSFVIRAAIYFAIWVAWTVALNAMTATSDVDLQAQRRRRAAIVSGWGLVFWGLTVTFASIDWGMSIEPHWYSSMYGVLFIAGQAVSAMAGAILIALFLRGQTARTNLLTTARQHDLANFLLAFVMFWSYVSLMQFLIIWSANLPEETPWYLTRSEGGWSIVVWGLVILHFLAPFLVLLLRETKRRAKRLAAVAILLLSMRFVDLCWLILPPFIPDLFGRIGDNIHRSPAGQTSALYLWPLLATMPAVGGLWFTAFAFNLSQRIRLPVMEPKPPQEPDYGAATQPTH